MRGGENTRRIAIAFAFFLAMAAFGPLMVQAIPTGENSSPIVAIITGYKPQPPQPEDYRKIITPNGETVHIINQIGAGTLKIWIGTTTPAGTPTYEGTWTTTFQLNLNVQSGLGSVQYKMIWTIPDKGTFEGNILGTMVAPLPTDNALEGLHGVLHGSDFFAGQRIMIIDGGRATGAPTTYVGVITGS